MFSLLRHQQSQMERLSQNCEYFLKLRKTEHTVTSAISAVNPTEKIYCDYTMCITFKWEIL